MLHWMLTIVWPLRVILIYNSLSTVCLLSEPRTVCQKDARAEHVGVRDRKWPDL